MKSIANSVRDNVKNLKPCVHGAEVLNAAEESGVGVESILDFSSSVNPLGPSRRALVAAKAAFCGVASYPDSNSTVLRSIIAERYGLGADNVVVGNGSTELMYLFAETFLRAGESAVIPAPTFGEYESAVRKAGETPKFVKLNRNLDLKPAEFVGAMADAKIVFLCNPNNPTSKLIRHDAVAEIVEAALAHDTLVFLDEDFLEFVEGGEAQSLIPKIQKYPNLFVLRSFTKIYGLTGLRVGYGVAQKEIIHYLQCAKIPWNVNCIAQAAAAAALQDEKHLQITRALIAKEKAWLQNELEKIRGFKFSPPDANFFFIDTRKSGFKAPEIKQKMLKRGILIRDCASFRGLDEFYVRVAVKTHAENLRLIQAFNSVIE
jgi:threonine-phosphate decarboxylase